MSWHTIMLEAVATIRGSRFFADITDAEPLEPGAAPGADMCGIVGHKEARMVWIAVCEMPEVCCIR